MPSRNESKSKFANGVEPIVRRAANAPQTEVDWAILRCVFGIQLRLTNGVPFEEVTVSEEEKRQELIEFGEEFGFKR